VNWGNYDSVLQQLRGAGLLVDSLVVGQRQRCRVEGDREKRGWYHLHELRLDDGRYLIVGSYGIWRGNDPGSTKVEVGRAATLSREQLDALRARMAADRKAEQAARRAEAERAALRAQAMWRRLSPQGTSEYLVRKCVQAHGLRFAPSGAVAVPLLDVAGQIQGLQFILPPGHRRRRQLGRDKDFWPAGLAKQGHMFPIGSPVAGGVCLVAEGYATAASLYEATGLPTVVAFDAGNLTHVAQALAKRYPGLRMLFCADDDYLGKCRGCGALAPTEARECPHCGQAPGTTNAGVSSAHAAALQVDGAVLVPRFVADRPLDRKGPTDFNDLHVLEGLQEVRAQVEARLGELGWDAQRRAPRAIAPSGGGGAQREHLQPITTADELFERFALVYEATDTAFDFHERVLVPLSSVRNLCASRQLYRQWMESPTKQVVRVEEVGFDPGERDPTVRCNLWAGWPTQPRAGCCDKLLELGEFLCSQDPNGDEMWWWLQRWLAYPIQRPGAKMKTAVIVHGPQGTGKNLFFESVLAIYGRYGRLLNQDAVEDKFNDWASRLLFGVADEMVARDEMYHAKNKLKTLITSDRIRINPKNLAPYYERNHANLVFLSNEIQPMALERDDRRYAVIWTPPKLEPEFYNAVLSEIDAGGIAALHDHLLRVDLDGFGPASLPPMTQAKRDLIELGMDSTESFFVEWAAGNLPLPATACRSEDLFDAYRHHCLKQGVHKPASLKTFVGAICKRPGVRRARRQHYRGHSLTQLVQSVVIVPPGATEPADRQALTDQINAFAQALRDWRSEGDRRRDAQGATHEPF
jgi:putative DNA primase/helicase